MIYDKTTSASRYTTLRPLRPTRPYSIQPERLTADRKAVRLNYFNVNLDMRLAAAVRRIAASRCSVL